MKKINLETIKTTITELKDTMKVENVKETPFDGMISSAFWMAGKIPVAGKVATKVLADSDLEAKSKEFANKYFNPFSITNKLAAAKN